MDMKIPSHLPCDACTYYRVHEHGFGACHRFPPSFAGDRSAKELHHWRFPLVSANNWCGEFRETVADIAQVATLAVVARQA